MKIITFIIFLEYIKQSFSSLPVWDFGASSFDLLQGNLYEDDVGSGIIWGEKTNNVYQNYRMHRTIKKDGGFVQ